MAIQRSFRGAVLSFLTVLASGAFTPAAADPFWLHSATIEPTTTDSLVEQSLNDAGSVSIWLPIPPAAPRDPYPLVMNPEVQHFLDRFTRERRDLISLWINRSSRYLGMMREVLKA